MRLFSPIRYLKREVELKEQIRLTEQVTDEAMAEAKMRHKEEMKEAKETHKQAMEEAIAKHRMEKAEAGAQHRREKKELRQQNEEELRKLKTDVEEGQKARFQSLMSGRKNLVTKYFSEKVAPGIHDVAVRKEGFAVWKGGYLNNVMERTKEALEERTSQHAVMKERFQRTSEQIQNLQDQCETQTKVHEHQLSLHKHELRLSEARCEELQSVRKEKKNSQRRLVLKYFSDKILPLQERLALRKQEGFSLWRIVCAFAEKERESEERKIIREKEIQREFNEVKRKEAWYMKEARIEYEEKSQEQLELHNSSLSMLREEFEVS
jgi:hypothetical protein